MAHTHKTPAVRFGIQARVLALAVLFTLLTAGIILITSTLSLSAQLRRSVIQSAEYTLQTSAAILRRNIREVDDLSRWCRVDSTVRTAMLSSISNGTLTNTVYPIISNKFSSMHTAPYIQRFLIYGSNARLIMLGTAASQSVLLDRDNIGRLPGVAGESPVSQWEQIIPDPLLQPGITLAGIPVSSIMYSSDRSHTAWVYLSVSPTLVTDALRGFTLEEGAWLCWIMGGQLYRVEGDQLVCLGGADRLPDPETGVEDTLGRDTLLYSARLDGVDCSIVACPLGLHQLYLAEVISNDRMAHPLSLLGGPALVSLALVLVMGLGMSALLHRTVAAPIVALQRQMGKVGRGDFSVDPAIEWNHELGDVGRGINELSRGVSSLMEKRIEDEQQRLALEYQMLQSQISPHFIYNTLNSIKWMATIQHAPGVAEMVTALSRLLKSVSKGTQKLVPLEEEFALLEDYFTIQRYRYGGTISLETPALDESYRNYLIPRFTLQPLTENAIFHGIEPKGGVGKLWVTIDRDQPSGDLLISMADDGVGMEEEQIRRLLAGPGRDRGEDGPFRHVGMWSVHRLLQLSFGPDYGLDVRSVPGQGTAVTLRLPERPQG